jgi:exonuclease III
MTLSLATINVNGLRDKKKRDLVFNWLVAKQIDVICLQETHSTKDDLSFIFNVLRKMRPELS